jgi:GrpB-like predicted nucleotidyltransferase (UPF0157 family)
VDGKDDAFVIRARPPGAARECFAEIARMALARLPHTEIRHFGSTAVAGCLTKGDMDTAVRVSAAGFPAYMDD